MASTSCVGNGKLGDGWGTTKVGGVGLSTRCYDTTIETKSLLSCPTLSAHGAGLVGFTAAHWIVLRGRMLVAIGRIATVAAVVTKIQIIAVGPAVIEVLIAFAGRSQLILPVGWVVIVIVVVVVLVVVVWHVVRILVVIVVVVVVIVAAPGVVGPMVVVVVVVAAQQSSLELLKLRLKQGEFGIFDRILLKELLIGSLKATEHVTVSGCSRGKVGKGFSCFVGKIGDTIGIVISRCLGGMGHFTQFRVGLGKVCLELSPCFGGIGPTMPFTTGIDEHAYVVDEVVGVEHNLFRRVCLSPRVANDCASSIC
jgi:hypothetical protein